MRSTRIILSLIAGVVFLCCAVAFSSSPPPVPKPAHLVAVVCEDEYRARETVPPLARELAKAFGLRCTVLLGNESKTHIPGLEMLRQADVLMMFLRRTMLPANELRLFQEYFDRGGHVIALRTSSHAFQNWLEFDHLVLGGNYHGHYGRKLVPTVVSPVPQQREHPIVRGFPQLYRSQGTLYKTSPVASDATVLLTGRVRGQAAEPVAWLRHYRGGVVFYTSLGHPEDFAQAAFRKLIRQALGYMLDQER